MTPPLVCLHNPICEQCLKLEVHLVLYCRGTHTHTCLVINVIVNQNLSVWLYSVHLHYMRAWWNDRLLIDLRNLPAPLPAVNNEYASTHTHTHICVKLCLSHNKCQVYVLQQCDAWPAPNGNSCMYTLCVWSPTVYSVCTVIMTINQS